MTDKFDISQIGKKIEGYKSKGLKIFSTSSFQTQSVVLLHIISRIDKSIPVFFLQTGYHFPETLEYKKHLVRSLGLNVIDLGSFIPKSMQRDSSGRLLFTSDPDHCCHLNKVAPLDAALIENDVWINGIRADQSETRQAMQEEEMAPHSVIRYHPMLNWTLEDVNAYIKKFNLPRHPLDELGFVSIGCEPCTRRITVNEDSRSGRWYGLNKTECGLHTELVSGKQ